MVLHQLYNVIKRLHDHGYTPTINIIKCLHDHGYAPTIKCLHYHAHGVHQLQTVHITMDIHQH